ncbi:glycosyltransferase 87 family protein [Labedaea rhizosphaerae]|uniref:Uncharacterized protein DUF2029 n=1 Tax=Labedaea rhizosphaerae TaxID=598644 RepID=A0A4R6RYE4_LABRH|nr:glycosyltransferase 87 family protein [Labedaea rhizosphaerae]TDP92141.1 uncharacterized protein DUF2029 [Labedaea rhizosphaerae]
MAMFRGVRADLLVYGAGFVFAAVTTFASEFYGYRVWGNVAAIGYLIAFVHVCWLGTGDRAAAPKVLRSRWTPVGVVGVFAIVAPMFYLMFRRSPNYVWGPWPWSFPSQPEVWVVERSARLLIDHGTPYTNLDALGRAPVPDDYTPYGPAMTIFGLPRAVFGNSGITDARLMFVLGSAVAIGLALWVLGKPKVPVGAGLLMIASPLTTLIASTAGDDLPVIALVVLATALAARDHRPASAAWSGVVCALVVMMKLTALPALGVLAVFVLARTRWRGFAAFAGALLAAGAVLVVPVLVRDPGSFVEHVIKFPAGLGRAHSPAASPLPGHLIASTGSAGHTIALLLLLLAGGAMIAWLVLRPPRTGADAMLRIAVGLAAAILLAPATRWGYLVYPVAMLGAVIAFRAVAEQRHEQTPG